MNKLNICGLLFILTHFVLWTAAPALVRYNLPLDSIEGALWGHQLEWGYDKNPFLNGWLTSLAIFLGGSSGWMVYLFSQLSVATCFWFVWRLAKQMLSPVYALVSLMMLEGVQYFHIHAIDFNDNTLELGLWAATIYFFYQATRKPTYLAWMFTGLLAGLALMAKYYTATLLASMFLFLLSRKENRKQLMTLSPYLGLLVFIAVILPHTIWLFFHDFITVHYVFARASNIPNWTNHLFFPAKFAWEQIEVFLPAIILFSILWIGKKDGHARGHVHGHDNSRDDMAFLFFIAFGPFLLTLFISFLLGITLRAGWGMPLLSLWGIVLVAFFQPAITPAKLKRFVIAIFVVMFLLVTGYAYSLIHPSTTTSANFPGKEIAILVTEEWRQTYHTPLKYVAGSRWIGGNINFYSSDHPAVFVEWDTKKAPWIDNNDMKKHGAVFVWDIAEGEKLPKKIQRLYMLNQPIKLEFLWHRNKKLEPVMIGVAYLSPEQR